MKSWFTLWFFLHGILTAMASDSIPARLANEKMPAFTLLQADSTYFFQKDLSTKKHTVIMLFSPDCDHCQSQTRALTDSLALFSNTQFVMSTTLPFDRLKDFYRTYNLVRHKKQLKVGRDFLFFFSKYFQNHFLPFIAVYDSRQNLKAVYEGNVSMKELLRITN